MLKALIFMTFVVGFYTGGIAVWLTAYCIDRKAVAVRHRTTTLDDVAQDVDDLCRVETPLAPTILV